MDAARPGPRSAFLITFTRFIGRHRDVDEIRGLLAKRRLLTLTGPGGSGKTRLALKAAAGLDAEFPGGIWLAELAELVEPSLLPEAVAAALGVREVPGRSALDAMIPLLGERRALLLLDNCEHLLDACAQLAAALLHRCPTLHLLATSRQALGLPGETVRPVLPLAVPPSDASHDPAALSQIEAVALFLDRARALTPDFALTAANARAVSRICRLLDGMPLAIELAATRVQVLDAAEIAARLDESHNLLVAASRLGPPRHETMRAAIDWSHALLSAPEQRIWRYLSVFRGSFSLEAADAVCGTEVLNLLARLVDKSLVVVVRDADQTRYRLLEPLRQYAAERLDEAGERPRLQERHRDYSMGWAERHEAGLRGPEQMEWLSRFDNEYPNLRAALAALHDSPDGAAAGLRLAVALGSYWFLRNLLNEGRRWLEAALSRPGAEPPTTVRAQALYLASVLAFFQGDYGAARRHVEESHGLAQSLDFSGLWGIAYSLMMLGQVVRFDGEREPALRYLAESVVRFRTSGDRWGLAVALASLGEVSIGAGDFGAARAAFRESQAHWRAVGDPWGLALNQHQMAFLAYQEGDDATAQALFMESNPTFEALGDVWHVAHAHRHMGDMALRQGGYAVARDHYQRCLPLFQRIGDEAGTAAVTFGLGAVAVAHGDAGEADSLLRTALAHYERRQRPLVAAVNLERLAEIVGRTTHRELAADLRRAAGALRLAAAPGASDSPSDQRDESFSEAHAAIQNLVRAIRASKPTGPLAELTGREIEVLRLIAEGLTNQQIAERLVISPRTVNAHLRSIYSKLGVGTRTAAARLAIEQHLF